jgi:hypothetical protein
MVGEFREGQAATREGLSWSHRCNQRDVGAELWRVDGELAYRSGESLRLYPPLLSIDAQYSRQHDDEAMERIAIVRATLVSLRIGLDS